MANLTITIFRGKSRGGCWAVYGTAACGNKQQPYPEGYSEINKAAVFFPGCADY